jgi:acyl-CoA thioesterase-1
MTVRRPSLARLALLLALGACSAPEVPELRQDPPPRPLSDRGTGSAVGGETGRERAAGGRSAEARPLVVFLGDSLTAGYGLAADEAYPALVERLLAARGLPIAVLNAGVSGDTTAGGLARLDWLLEGRPDLVVVALGGNDGLRALSPATSEENLRRTIERIRAAGARPVLVGMRVPPNYGPDYVREFEAIFPRLAEEYDLPFVPFLLAGVAAEPELNLPDGIHPNVEGQRIVARTIADALAPLVAEIDAPRAAGAAAP